MKKEEVADKPNITPNFTFARMFLHQIPLLKELFLHQIPLYGMEDGIDCLRLARSALRLQVAKNSPKWRGNTHFTPHELWKLNL